MEFRLKNELEEIRLLAEYIELWGEENGILGKTHLNEFFPAQWKFDNIHDYQRPAGLSATHPIPPAH